MSDNIAYGGQAVIEGVMMRSPHFFSVACRRENGEIVVRTERVPVFFTRYKWARWPFMRGVFALADAMVLGMKSLLWSANIAALDDREAAGRNGGLVEEGPDRDEAVAELEASLGSPGVRTARPGSGGVSYFFLAAAACCLRNLP